MSCACLEHGVLSPVTRLSHPPFPVREESSDSESDFDDDMIEEDDEDLSEERNDQIYVRLSPH